MLAKRVSKLPEGPAWSYECKLDGWRVEAIKDASGVRLFSRRGKSLTASFESVAECVRKIKARTAILDGELVAVDQRGRG
jgi:bifunctional non-homologous end joining protein LigD